MDRLDTLKRDRFELLSAYLDGEVTAVERKQVESWLATDPDTQRLHARLLKLRHGLHNLPVPASPCPLPQTVEQVFARLDRRPRLTLVWGGIGAAAAAVFVGVLTSLVPGTQLLTPQTAQQVPAGSAEEALMIALEQPPIEIPQTPATPSTKSSPGLKLEADPSQDIR